MTTGYVIFSSEAVFNTAHETAKTSLGLPRVGILRGKPAPDKQQTTEITESHPHPSDGTVVAYINGGWPDDEKEGFVFKTQAQVAEYFAE